MLFYSCPLDFEEVLQLLKTLALALVFIELPQLLEGYSSLLKVVQPLNSFYLVYALALALGLLRQVQFFESLVHPKPPSSQPLVF